MDFSFLTKQLLKNSKYEDMLRLIKEGKKSVGISGPAESQKAHLAYSINVFTGRKVLYLTSNELIAGKIHADLQTLTGGSAVLFQAAEALLYSMEASSHENTYSRIAALQRIYSGDYDIAVSSSESFARKMVQPELILSNIKIINCGDKGDIYELSDWLARVGYERTSIVEGKGQYALRGGIIDVFPVQNDYPDRIEFFDDIVDSIRSFDMVSQRSQEEKNTSLILPARELLLPEKEKCKEIASRIRNENSTYHNLEEEIYKIESGIYFTGMDKYLPWLVENPCDLADHIKAMSKSGQEPVIILDEPEQIKARLSTLHIEYNEACIQLIEKGKMLPGGVGFYYTEDEIFGRVRKTHPVFLETLKTAESEASVNFALNCRQLPPTEGKIDLILSDIRKWKSSGNSIVIIAGTEPRAQRMANTLTVEGLDAAFYPEGPETVLPSSIYITAGGLAKGFEYIDTGLVVVTEGELAGQPGKPKRTRLKKRRKGTALSSFTDLKVGDFVVHEVHGIGKYEGIEKITVDGITKDYLKILYQNESRLFVPVQQLNIVQKYVGSEGKTPRLNKLGSGDWDKTKARIKESLKDMAAELVAIYAERQKRKGFSFSPDTIWQKQFEDEFPYNPTEDQLKCVEEIKADMESEKPMDRLLCGDVGFGKTEVGLRALFKCIMDGKQSAWLVPTTVLAQQHYESFKKRFEGYPVSIEMLSRFRSKADQKKILESLAAGKIDILIGTHRLLQKDIKFKNPGLLVIDEEHRFGVAHKEKLKAMYPDVDVLSLSATPIPRTLHMSLVGIRDISTIDEPPESRYPVQTYVMEFDEGLLKDAIYRELSRGGQVFYLFNRVRNIEEKASFVQRLVPEARVTFAHGKMNEKELEEVMLSFLNYEYDILVCTTIIESGLDIGNVNTIIMEDADKLGLAQLYQLRGRVGRAGRTSYAYVTYRRDKVLTEIAGKRLQAIREFTEFGSGFRIAMRDMEIRGAGNILGAEQHGHMETVGYEMYCRLLAEAMKEQRIRMGNIAQVPGIELPEMQKVLEETMVDLGVSAFIPRDYVQEENSRIETYEKIAGISNEEELFDVRDELLDRFGNIPEEAEALCYISLIRALGTKCGFSLIKARGNKVEFRYGENVKIDSEAITRLASEHRGELLFNAGNPPYLILVAKNNTFNVTKKIVTLLKNSLEYGSAYK